MTVAAEMRRPRRQNERRAESGRRLVQAAVALIAEGGVSSATFQAIGARSGYSASLVTERFGSKSGLTEAILAYLQESNGQLLDQVERKRISGLEALLRYIELWVCEVAVNPERQAYSRLLDAAVSDPCEGRARFAAGHDLMRDRLAMLVERGQQDGSIRTDIAPSAAGLFVGSLQLGLAMQLQVDPEMPLARLGGTVQQILGQSLARL